MMNNVIYCVETTRHSHLVWNANRKPDTSFWTV